VDLRALPKVELHRHLEGAVRLETILDLYLEAGRPLPARTPQELAEVALVRRPVGSLEEALRAFGIAQGAFFHPAAVRRIAYEAVQDLARENVRLAELRFSPEFMCEPAGLDWDTVTDAVIEGVQSAVAEGSDVAVGLIVIFSRDYGMASGRRTVDFALRRRADFVGVDVAGPELRYPPGDYVEILAPLHDAGIPLTLHYGESGPPEYARDAMAIPGVRRLGHGLAIHRDDDTTGMAADLGVALEMCPTSNWLTRGVPTVADHPARRLLREGVKVTLNTDDPGLMGIDLTHEFEVARDELGFGESDFAAVTRNALEASFLPDGVKTTVRERHFGWVGAS
jgi:adenosine deaminase